MTLQSPKGKGFLIHIHLTDPVGLLGLPLTLKSGITILVNYVILQIFKLNFFGAVDLTFFLVTIYHVV